MLVLFHTPLFDATLYLVPCNVEYHFSLVKGILIVFFVYRYLRAKATGELQMRVFKTLSDSGFRILYGRISVKNV